jgi:hypothetical protein
MDLTRRSFIGLLAGALAVSACPSILIPKHGTKTIVPVRRKLKAVWTVECEQDLQAFHGINVREHLMNQLSNQLRDEIDNQIISYLT